MANHKPNKPKLSQVPRFHGRPRFESFEAEVEGQGPNFEQVAALKGLTTYERWMRILKDPSAPTLYYLWRAFSNGRLDPEIKRAVDDSGLEIPSSPLEGETLRIVRDCCEVGRESKQHGGGCMKGVPYELERFGMAGNRYRNHE